MKLWRWFTRLFRREPVELPPAPAPAVLPQVRPMTVTPIDQPLAVVRRSRGPVRHTGVRPFGSRRM
jgi:hypothetical protein